jgi:pullulanase
VKTKKTFDPISDKVKEISPARQHMLTFLTRWMQDFQIDGIRMDSVENVANWDFIRDFKKEARDEFKKRYPAEGNGADAKFLVVGEELQMPPELLTQKRLDGLWNERFQGLVRAALLGENVGGLNFEDTVRRAIDCRIQGVFTDGAQAINYLTSHDVQDARKERLYNLIRLSSHWQAASHCLTRVRSRKKCGTTYGTKAVILFPRRAPRKCGSGPMESSCIKRDCGASSWASCAK